MSISQSIIENEVLSVDQADTIFSDLMGLENMGFWNTPEWAAELAAHFQLSSAACPSVIMVAWKSVAVAYEAARG